MLLGFFVPIICYRIGLKEGYEMANGKMPKTIQNPIKTITESIEAKKENKQAKEERKTFLEGLNNIMAYDGEPQEGDK
jgi:hypothetical protein